MQCDLFEEHYPGRLLALHDDIQPQEYTLNDDVCIIGRVSGCHLVVPRPIVSRLHARIERHGPRYIISDTDSANGTFINNRRIHELHMLKDYDVVGLGSPMPLLRFVDPDPTSTASSRLVYDDRLMVFSIDNQAIELTPTLFRLLIHLYQHVGEVCTRESCAEAIWGADYAPGMEMDTLDRTFNSLRGRLRQIDPETTWIETRRGLGYILHL